MKLDHNCVRYLLLSIEENIEFDSFCHVTNFSTKKFSDEQLMYAALKLLEGGYINATPNRSEGHCSDVLISSLTWDGHELLDNLRDNKVWKITSDILSKFTSTSVSIISNVAAQVITELIKSGLSPS